MVVYALLHVFVRICSFGSNYFSSFPIMNNIKVLVIYLDIQIQVYLED